MAINKKLIHFKNKSAFNTELTAGNILDTSIVFIKDTKEIWTHGQLYSCDPLSEEEIDSLIKNSSSISELTKLLNNKVDKVSGKSLLSDTEITKLSELPNNTVLNDSISAAKKAGTDAQTAITAHQQNKSNPHAVTKSQIGLGNVTNDAQVKRSEMGIKNGVATLDENIKIPVDQLPIATTTTNGIMTSAEKSKLSGIESGAQKNTVTSVNNKTGAITLTKADLTLDKVDNTSDANKPVSTAQATAIADAKKAGTDAQAAVTAEATARENAIKALDATITSTDGTNVQVKVTETDGKITAVNITTDNTAKNSDLTAEVTRAKAAEADAKKAGTDAQTALNTHANNTLIHVPSDGAEGQFLKWVGTKPAWANETLDTSVTEQLYGYGVEWNPNVKDPHVDRIGNMAFHKSLPIQSQMKGCIAKKVGNVWQVQYYLKEDDWTKKEDGTASRLDGFDGEVMVEVPKFYYKSWDKPNIKRVMISQTKIDSDWIESPKMLVGAYRSTALNTVPSDMGYLSSLPVNSAVSIKNTAAYCRGGNNNASYDTYLTSDQFRSQLGKPRTAISRATMRTYSRNAGKEMLNYNQYKSIFYWLYVIEYANFNCQDTFNDTLTAEGYKQGGLGAGVTTLSDEYWNRYNGYYPITPCGYCDEFGNGTGIKAATLPPISITSSLTTSINYTRNTYTETIDNIPYTKYVWESTTTSDVVTITKVNKSDASGMYTTRSNQSGSTVYKVEGLQSGQSLIFYKGSTILGTASSNGNITIDWGNDSATRSIRASFIGECNIRLSIVSASQTTYDINGYTVQVPRWRGFDNPFGDIWTNLDGIIIGGNAPDYATATVYTTSDPSNYGDSAEALENMEQAGTEIKQDGYIKTFNLGSTAEIIPNAVGGSTTTYKCDYHYQGGKDASLRTLLGGGCAHHGAYAGLGSFYSYPGVSNSYAYIGFQSVSLVS